MKVFKDTRSGDRWWLLRLASPLLLLLGVLLPAAVVIVATSSPASAEVYQCDTQGSGFYFDGTITHTSSVIGTAANIVNRLGAVCDTDRTNVNTSWGWSMLAGYYAECQYAQTGFLRFYGTPDYFFSQDNRCTGVIDTVLGASPAYGQTHHYWIQWSQFSRQPLSILGSFGPSPSPISGWERLITWPAICQATQALAIRHFP